MPATTTAAGTDNSPTVTDQQVQDFYAYLKAHATGREHALPARALIAPLRLGSNGDRLLRALAHRATEMNLLVCADNSGYFVPLQATEVEEMVGRLRSQAQQMNERARRIESLSAQHFVSTQLPLI